MDMLDAIAINDVERVGEIVSEGADEALDEALSCAAAYGHVGVIDVLVAAGADPSDHGVLVRAAEEGKLSAVKHLIEAHGVDPCDNAIRRARSLGHDAVVAYLQEHYRDRDHYVVIVQPGRSQSEIAEFDDLTSASAACDVYADGGHSPLLTKVFG